MTTTADIVTAALREIGVVANDVDASTAEISNGVSKLNRMLAAWKLAGVDVDAFELESTDDFPLESEYHEGAVYLLAQRMSSEYMLPANFNADNFLRLLQAAHMTIEEATIPLGLRQMPSQYWPDKIRR